MAEVGFEAEPSYSDILFGPPLLGTVKALKLVIERKSSMLDTLLMTRRQGWVNDFCYSKSTALVLK